MSERRQRANGIASRAAILDAAAQIAGERGYEGTSIKLVQERSGLPASSIYWHFKNKDELIAAVIDRSYHDWVDALTVLAEVPDGTTIEELLVSGLRNAGEQLARFPDFLRLGLMLTLERRPTEPTARQRFYEVRVETLELVRGYYKLAFDGLRPKQISRLATMTLAGSDGLFIAADSDPKIKLADEFELLGHAVLGAARSMGWEPAAVDA